MRTSRVPSAPFRRDPDPLNRVLKRFALFAWRIRYGWVLLLVTGAVLTALSVGLLVTFPEIPQLVFQAIWTMLLLAWMCVAFLTGMFRRALRGRTVVWDQLSAVGKLARVIVTVLGTMVLLAPFAWITWLALR